MTDPAILTQAPTITVPPDYLGAASGATTCGAEIDGSVVSHSTQDRRQSKPLMQSTERGV